MKRLVYSLEITKNKTKIMLDKIKFNPDFLERLETYAQTHDIIIFRYGDGCDFMELKPEFVIECIKEARIKIQFTSFDIDELSALDRLALYALDEASKNL